MTVTPNHKIIGAAWTSRVERIMSGKRDYDILIKEQQDEFGAGNLDKGAVIRSKMAKLASSIERDESLQELSYRVMSHAVVHDMTKLASSIERDESLQELSYRVMFQGVVHDMDYIRRVLVTLGEDAEGPNTFLGASLVVMVYVSQESATDRQMEQCSAIDFENRFAEVKRIALKHRLLIENTGEQTCSFNCAEFGDFVFSSPPLRGHLRKLGEQASKSE